MAAKAAVGQVKGCLPTVVDCCAAESHWAAGSLCTVMHTVTHTAAAQQSVEAHWG